MKKTGHDKLTKFEKIKYVGKDFRDGFLGAIDPFGNYVLYSSNPEGNGIDSWLTIRGRADYRVRKRASRGIFNGHAYQSGVNTGWLVDAVTLFTIPLITYGIQKAKEKMSLDILEENQEAKRRIKRLARLKY